MTLEVAQRRATVSGIGRRRLLRNGFLAAAGLAALGGIGATLKYVWPQDVKGFGGQFAIAPDRFPKAGESPARIIEAKAYLVYLQAGEGAWGELGKPAERAGYLALWQRCPHLGCTVPWAANFNFSGTAGWFRCPCHQSTYTKAGIRVFGPAPRPMDTFALNFDEKGRLVIDTGKISNGGLDNPLRVTPGSSTGA